MITNANYKGVSWDKKVGKWHVDLVVEGHHMHLGYFDDELKAAHVYNEMAVQYWGGDLTVLNTLNGKIL